jgi:Antimicrobial peptide resistance and lipid A acylation protein PagP
MKRSRWISSLLTTVAAVVGAGSVQAQAGDWDVVLNGRAVHVGAEKHWNEENWGLGVEHEFKSSGRWVTVAMANAFRDSIDKPSYMAGGGIKRRFRMFSDDLYFDVGVVGFLMTREDVDHNRPFPGALPAVTFGSKRVAVNVTYMPEVVVDNVTHANLRDPHMNGVFFIQLKLDASLFGFSGRKQMYAAVSETDTNQ